MVKHMGERVAPSPALEVETKEGGAFGSPPRTEKSTTDLFVIKNLDRHLYIKFSNNLSRAKIKEGKVKSCHVVPKRSCDLRNSILTTKERFWTKGVFSYDLNRKTWTIFDLTKLNWMYSIYGNNLRYCCLNVNRL